MSEWNDDEREYVEGAIVGSIYHDDRGYQWFLCGGLAEDVEGIEPTIEAARAACDAAFLRFAAAVKGAAEGV